MNKPVAPDWMKEVVRKCDGDITKLDPPVKKEIRAFIKKVNKWERIQKTKEKEVQRAIMLEDMTMNGGQYLQKLEEKQYEDLLRDQENTIDWNRNLMWKCDCGCESFRVVKTPHLIHYGKYQCNLCHKHHGWVPRPQHDENL